MGRSLNADSSRTLLDLRLKKHGTLHLVGRLRGAGCSPSKVAAKQNTVEPPADVDFSDLETAPGGCFRIADTALRAVSLDQLVGIAQHVARRMGCELKVEKDRNVRATWKQ